MDAQIKNILNARIAGAHVDKADYERVVETLLDEKAADFVSYEKLIDALEAQVDQLTEEVARLELENQKLRSNLNLEAGNAEI